MSEAPSGALQRDGRRPSALGERGPLLPTSASSLGVGTRMQTHARCLTWGQEDGLLAPMKDCLLTPPPSRGDPKPRGEAPALRWPLLGGLHSPNARAPSTVPRVSFRGDQEAAAPPLPPSGTPSGTPARGLESGPRRSFPGGARAGGAPPARSFRARRGARCPRPRPRGLPDAPPAPAPLWGAPARPPRRYLWWR